MIYFMEYSSGGIRGGELYNAHLHRFIKSKFEVDPEEICPFPRELRNPIRHSLFSLKSVKAKKPQLIVFDISSGMRNLLAIRSMKKNKRKSLLIIQEERLNLRWDNFFVKWLIRQVEKYLVINSDIFVVNSRYSADLARKKGAPQNAPIIIAHPGMENFLKDTEINADIPEPPSETFEILYVGVCKKHKGIIYLVKAVSLLKNCNINLNIVGQYSSGSKYYKHIQRFIERNGLKDRVKFHGFLEREKLFELFSKSQLYVHPSLMEGYGMVLAEAMSFGLPIVSTTAGAIPELIENRVNGILVNPASSKELAGAIESLYKDIKLRNAISLNNLEKVKNLYTWEDFDKTLEKKLVPVIVADAGLAPRN
ncbi:MAG: glycosyltransferase family 4 protein [Candidatus Zixiibacteriota bacterium]|nr:MAG: glycosyltransferase family 4 protein [candidate division Zixibacteria bacterium]